jgi:hypothetical protein
MTPNSAIISLGLCIFGAQMLSNGIIGINSYNTYTIEHGPDGTHKDSNYLFAISNIVFGASLLIFAGAYAILPRLVSMDDIVILIFFGIMVAFSFAYGLFSTYTSIKNISNQQNSNTGSDNLTITYVVLYGMYFVALFISIYGFLGNKM